MREPVSKKYVWIIVLVAVIVFGSYILAMLQYRDTEPVRPIRLVPEHQLGEAQQSEFMHVSSEEGSLWIVETTAYNSLPDQTQGDPFETATGMQTQSGIVAISRDLLPSIPHGSVIRFVDLEQLPETPYGCGATLNTVHRLETLPGLPPGHFRVEDTLGPDSALGVDVWLEHLDDALRWGRCLATIEVVDDLPLEAIARSF